jgi:hypothetical protein
MGRPHDNPGQVLDHLHTMQGIKTPITTGYTPVHSVTIHSLALHHIPLHYGV